MSLPTSAAPADVASGREAWVRRHVVAIALVIVTIALVVRLYYAGACFINGDEGQHFSVARWHVSLIDSHLALAHPPLLLVVLRCLLPFGDGVLFLRLPSVLAGSAALLLAFGWLRRSLGDAPALAGLVFLAFSPAAISAATEIRQYGLLIFCLCGALYALERFFSEKSAPWAWVHAAFLSGAALSHYSAILVIVALGLWGIARSWREQLPPRLLGHWAGSQLGIAGVCLALYLLITRAQMAKWGQLGYLSDGYYTPGRDTPLQFAWHGVIGTFEWALRWEQWAATLLLATTVIGLVASRRRAIVFPLLVALPFVVAYGAAVAGLFPFSGTRHVTYLLPFVAAGVAAGVTRLCRERAWIVLLASILAGLPWLLLTAPDNDPRITPQSDMTAALALLRRDVPAGSRIYVDNNSRFVLRYYLGRDIALRATISAAGREFRVPDYNLFTPAGSPWEPRPTELGALVRRSVEAQADASDGQPWVVSTNWLAGIEDIPAAPDLVESARFGRIGILRLADR